MIFLKTDWLSSLGDERTFTSILQVNLAISSRLEPSMSTPLDLNPRDYKLIMD
jgi:hypothetical protein